MLLTKNCSKKRKIIMSSASYSWITLGGVIIIILTLSTSTSSSASSTNKSTTKVSGFNKNYCKCTHLIARSFFSYGLCGSCALCYWNLFYFADSFKGNDANLASSVVKYETAFKKCAQQIPAHPTLEVKKFTQVFFKCKISCLLNFS